MLAIQPILLRYFAHRIPLKKAIVLGLLVLLAGEYPLPGQGKTPLRGSAVIQGSRVDDSESSETSTRDASIPSIRPYGALYAPRQPEIRQADAWVADYKINAAEALYRNALHRNPKSPGALNGLGKIAYYKTASSNQNWRAQTDALYEEAIQRFLSALRYQPGYLEAHLNLASVYMEQNRWGDAADAIAKAQQLAPNHDEVLLKKGEWLARQAQFNEAMPYLKRAIRLNSANASAHYFLGVSYASQNQQNEALQEFHTAAWLNPRHALTHYQMGLIYAEQGNDAAAVEHFKTALSLKPELEDTRQKLASYYEQHGDWAAAIDQYQLLQASSLAPQWAIADRIGKLGMRNNQPDLAVKTYRQWLMEHPEDAQAAQAGLSLAKTEVSRKKLRDDELVSAGEAKRYAEQALQYQPNNFEARMIDVKLDRQIGGEPSAMTRAKQEPGWVDASLNQPAYQPYQSFEQGELLLARYQFLQAEQALRTARRTGEKNRSQVVFGELFLNMGLPDLAIEAFQQVLQQLPQNASARLGMSKAQEAKRQSAEWVQEALKNTRKSAIPVAIYQLEKALKANLKNANAHYQIAQLYEKQENYAPAADHYYAYLQLEPHSERAASTRRKIESLKIKIAEGKGQGAP